MSELLDKLGSLAVSVLELVAAVLALALHWAPLMAWLAWGLLIVDWRNVWPPLRRGGWVAMVLLAAGGALAWNALSPGPIEVAGWVREGYLGKLWVSLGVVFSAVLCGLIQRLVLQGSPWFWAEEAAPAPNVEPSAGGHH